MRVRETKGDRGLSIDIERGRDRVCESESEKQ